VRLVGTDNFPEIVVTTADDVTWIIARNEMDLLHHLQTQKVTVEGIGTVKEIKLANGRNAGIRRELRDIKIIEIF
jgi:hypothetical protein